MGLTVMNKYVGHLRSCAQANEVCIYSALTLAHFSQIQALFLASSGTRSRSSDEKVAVMRQQALGGFPVALAIS